MAILALEPRLKVMMPEDCKVTFWSTIKSAIEEGVEREVALRMIVVEGVLGLRVELMPNCKLLPATPMVAVPAVTVIVARPGLLPVPTPSNRGV